MLDVYIDIVAMSLLNRIKTTTLRLLFVCVYVCTACLHDASTRARTILYPTVFPPIARFSFSFFVARATFFLLSFEPPSGMKWKTIQFQLEKSLARYFPDKNSGVEIRL